MPCFHPMPAWRTQTGEISLAKEKPDTYLLRLPCGNCLGCRMARAKEWTLRCWLEQQDHEQSTVTTLTYRDEEVPPTLRKRDLQLFLKKLRRATDQKIRFFASGEYGEDNGRPHYHAILYGLATDDEKIGTAWDKGFHKSEPITLKAVSYIAGYVAKKIGYKNHYTKEWKLDLRTERWFQEQAPFIQMSRGGKNGLGIGATAKIKWPQSWRSFAILNGTQMPVPRYLHEAWKQLATEEQIIELELEKAKIALNRDTTTPRLAAAEQIAVARQKQQAERRTL